MIKLQRYKEALAIVEDLLNILGPSAEAYRFKITCLVALNKTDEIRIVAGLMRYCFRSELDAAADYLECQRIVAVKNKKSNSSYWLDELILAGAAYQLQVKDRERQLHWLEALCETPYWKRIDTSKTNLFEQKSHITPAIMRAEAFYKYKLGDKASAEQTLKDCLNIEATVADKKATQELLSAIQAGEKNPPLPR